MLFPGGYSGGGLPGDAGVGDDNRERAFRALFQEGAIGFVVVLGAVGVKDLHVAGAKNLEAVVEVGSGSEVLGPETGAGVIDFEEFDGTAGAIADGGGDVGGAAAGYCDKSGECEGGDRTHESQEYQPARAALFGC